MKVRQDFMGVDTRINTQEIHRVSQMVSQLLQYADSAE